MRSALWSARIFGLVGVFGALGSLGCGADADADADADSDSEDVPEFTYCDAEPIISDKCLRCHSEPLQEGAPISLETYELVKEEAASVRNALSTEGFMPAVWLDELEPPVQDLTEEERELLLDWLSDGAPRGEGCD